MMSYGKLLVSTYLILILGTAFTAAIPISDMDCQTTLAQLQDLYDYIVANTELRALHELVRKDGRLPSLRLRFGKRSDTEWPNTPAVKENYSN